MLNVEQLKWLADHAGFETYLQFDGKAMDVCVASLAFSSEDRFAPFNSHNKKINEISQRNVKLLRDAALNLADNGLLFVYGLPAHLSRYAVALSDVLTF